MANIKLDQVKKSFGKVDVIKDVDLDIADLRPQAGDRSAIRDRVREAGRDPAARGLLDRCQAAVRRPAPAGGDRPRHRARTAASSCSTSRCPTSTPRCGADADRDRQAARSLGATMIYVTHDQVEAMTLADRIVVLRDGRVEQVGDAARALPQPAEPLRRGLHRLAADELPRLRTSSAEAAPAVSARS
jgi:hypothetical protein